MDDTLLTALDHMLKPRHVAVIGASATPGKSGHAALRNLIAAGFPGRISAINPGGGSAEGIDFHASLGEVAEPVDCALLVVPAARTLQAVQDCAAAGTRTLIIGANGFGEQGTADGRRRQDEIDLVAREAGLRILGPNTNGIFNAPGRLALGYNTSHADPVVPGPVSVAAHSGALFNSFYPRLRRFGGGLASFVPVGNEADLTMLDFFEYFIADDDTRVIALMLESLDDMPRFRALAARAAEAGKPVLALKLGRSAEGAASALAHSSRLAGSGRAYEALFREAGVVSVPSVEALAGAATLLSRDPFVERRPLVGVTTSGGGGALLADYAAAQKLPLAGQGGQWTGAAGHAAESIEGSGLIRNPIDLGNLPDHGLLADLLAAQEAEGETGPIAAFAHQLPREEMDLRVVQLLADRRARVDAPIVVTAPGGLGARVREAYADAGVLLSEDLATSFDMLRAWYAYQAAAVPEPDAASASGPSIKVPAGKSVLGEIESARLLREAGIPVVDHRILGEADDPAAAATGLEYPLVLKAVPPDETHKARLGFVHTGIRSSADLHVAVEQMRERVTARGYTLDQVPLVLQPMLDGELELIAGVNFEPGLGHFLMLGLGGVMTEILDEVVLFPVPIAAERIADHLRTSRLGALLDMAAAGRQDMPKQLAEILAALQRLVCANARKVQSIDVNPVLLTAEGLVAVDALIILSGPERGGP